MDYEALGKRIRTRRKLMGLTQEELSEKAGISCSFMGHIERGSRKLSLETLIRLCDVLSVSSDYLLQDSMDSQTVHDAGGLSEGKKRLLDGISALLRETDI